MPPQAVGHDPMTDETLDTATTSKVHDPLTRRADALNRRDHSCSLKKKSAPVPEGLLGQLYQAKAHGLDELVATVPAKTRAMLALYCYRERIAVYRASRSCQLRRM